ADRARQGGADRDDAPLRSRRPGARARGGGGVLPRAPGRRLLLRPPRAPRVEGPPALAERRARDRRPRVEGPRGPRPPGARRVPGAGGGARRRAPRRPGGHGRALARAPPRVPVRQDPLTRRQTFVDPRRLPPSRAWPTRESPTTFTTDGLPDASARSSAGR